MDHDTCMWIIGGLGGFVLMLVGYIKYLVSSHMKDLREINGMSGGKHGHQN